MRATSCSHCFPLACLPRRRLFRANEPIVVACIAITLFRQRMLAFSLPRPLTNWCLSRIESQASPWLPATIWSSLHKFWCVRSCLSDVVVLAKLPDPVSTVCVHMFRRMSSSVVFTMSQLNIIFRCSTFGVRYRVLVVPDISWAPDDLLSLLSTPQILSFSTWHVAT